MIIGTALKIGDLVLAVQEESHDFLIHQAGALGIKDAEDKIQMYENYGFYDENGKFYNREEAALHAFECGQLPHKEGTTSHHYEW